MGSLNTEFSRYSNEILAISPDIFDYPVHIIGSPRAAARIPLETIHRIIDVSDLPDICSFSLVCRALATPARAALFCEVHLAGARFAAFATLLEQSPAIGRYVRSASVHWMSRHDVTVARWPALQARLTQLTGLTLGVAVPGTSRTFEHTAILDTLRRGAAQLRSVALVQGSFMAETLLSTIAAMPSLRELALRTVVHGPFTLDSQQRHALKLTTLHLSSEVHPSLHMWFENAVSPISIRHLSMCIRGFHVVNSASHALLKSLRGSLQFVTITTDNTADVYPLLDEEVCPHLQRVEMLLCGEKSTFPTIVYRLPLPALCPRSLAITLPILGKLGNVVDFSALHAHLCTLARVGLRWATLDIYDRKGPHLDIYYPARRMRDYEAMLAIFDVVGARPTEAPSDAALPERLRSSTVLFEWWAFGDTNLEECHVALEHDMADPTLKQGLRAQLRGRKLRGFHFVFNPRYGEGRDLHVIVRRWNM